MRAQEPQQQNDPYGPSYPESAVRFMGYRIAIVIMAAGLIIVGKSNLPVNPVKCIQDAVIDTLQPVASYYSLNEVLGLFLITFMQIIVDLQLLGMMVWWVWCGDSFLYPVSLSILGISKVIINAIFQTKHIDDAFTKQLLPSLIFSSNFSNTYFFSGISALLMINFMELYGKKVHRSLWIIQIILIIIISFLLLSMRLNFFMDITTGLVFGYFVYYEINRNKNIFDQKVIRTYNWILNKCTKKNIIQSGSQQIV